MTHECGFVDDPGHDDSACVACTRKRIAELEAEREDLKETITALERLKDGEIKVVSLEDTKAFLDVLSERDQYKAALEKIRDNWKPDREHRLHCWDGCNDWQCIANRALEPA